MARWARCELDDIMVAGETGGRRLARGAQVDLDERVAPGLTLGEALGEFRRFFPPLTTPQPRWAGLPRED